MHGILRHLRLFSLPLLALLLAGCSDDIEITDNYEQLIFIDDQEIDDDDPVVVELVVPHYGEWLAIHRDDGGAPSRRSRPIGVVAIDPTDNRNVEVSLDSAVAPGERLWGVVHVDDGIVGTFEYDGVDTTDRIYDVATDGRAWDDFIVR